MVLEACVSCGFKRKRWRNYCKLADTPLEYPRSFVLGGKKNLQGGKGKGIRGEREGKKKLKEKWKGKKPWR